MGRISPFEHSEGGHTNRTSNLRSEAFMKEIKTVKRVTYVSGRKCYQCIGTYAPFGYPEGVIEISRGLSPRNPRYVEKTDRIPEGCQSLGAPASRRLLGASSERAHSAPPCKLLVLKVLSLKRELFSSKPYIRAMLIGLHCMV